MAKKIREQDIFQEDIFANAKKSAEAYRKSLDHVTTELKELMQINNKLIQQSANELKTTQAIKQRQQALQDVNKSAKALQQVEQEKLKTEQQLERLEQQRQRTAQSRLRTETQQRKEKERLEKIAKKEQKQTQQNNRAYVKMSKTLNTLRNRYKDLVASGQANTKQARKLKSQIDRLDTSLKKIDKSVGQSQRNVGNYTSVWGRLGGTLKSVASGFGLVGGVMGAVSLIRNSFGVIVDFDSAIANLGAVSGASGEELEKLRNSALDLGESTKFTASEVAGLQLELAKLGFTTPEILDSTESILNLAAATGTDLANASQIAGSTLRAFNLDASEMDRVASTLGVATTKSALNMEFLQTAMSKVAPVSSALGFSIEDTTALLGGLANAGFDASTSATSTRSILLKLADSGGDLAQALGRPVKNLPDLVAGLRELDASGVDLAESLELTDKRSVAAFQTFLKNTDTLLDLKDGITDVNGELATMSEKQLNTVSGQLALLNSKWQGMILGTSDSAGTVDKLKNAIKFLTDNLETIVSVIFKAVKGFIIFKTTQLAVNTAMTIGRAVMVAYRVSVIAMNRGVKSATKTLKIFNKTMKANPIGLLISGLTTAIALLWDFGDASDNAQKSLERQQESMDKLNESLANNSAESQKRIKEFDAQSKLRIAQLQQEKAELEKIGATAEQLAEIDKQVRDVAIEQINKKIEEQTTLMFDASTEAENQVSAGMEQQRIIDKLNAEAKNLLELQRKGVNINLDRVRIIDKQLAKAKENLKIATQSADRLDQEVNAQNELIKGLEAEKEILITQNKTADIRNNLDGQRNKTVEYYRDLISDEQEKLNKVVTTRKEAIPIQRKIAEFEREIEKILGKQNKSGKTGNDLLKKRLAFEKDLNKVFQERNQVINKQNEEELDRQSKALDNQIQNELDLRREQAKSVDFVEQGQKVSLEKLQDLLNKKFEIEKQSVDDSADYQIKKETFLFNAKKKQIEQDVKEEKLTRDQADDLLLAEKSLFNEKLKLIDQERENDIQDLETDRVNAYKDSNEEIIDLQNATIDQIDKNNQTELDNEKDKLQERLQAYQSFTQEIIRLIDKRTDKQIDAINKELDASKKRQEELTALAIQGTTDATQSLATEQKRQAELERQKAELEKRKLRRQTILSGIELLSNKLDNNEGDAVANTIREITGLISILSNLPAFAEGSEYIERGDAPKGKDTILARVNEGERILTTEQNRKLGNVSNEELTKIVEHHNKGIFDDTNYLQPKVKNLHAPFQSTSMLLGKFDELKRAIEQKPMLTEVRWDEVSKMIVEKVETKNKITKNHQSTKGLF
jgi:TP901 family phage tail tape measure protein